MNWTDAENLCQASVETGEGHLASVLDQTTNDFITTLTVNMSWIGGFMSEDHTEWLWIDGSPWGYEAWLASEPNQMNNDEDYLNINWAAHIGLWADNPRGSLGFVCQYNQKGGYIHRCCLFHVSHFSI